MKIPFGDLRREVHELHDEVNTSIARVLERGWFVLGSELEHFEQEFASYLGMRHVVGCANGTDAITLALRACDLGPGDEVITVANTCVPTAAGIRDAGCTLRLVDCNSSTLQMDADRLESAITPSTRAVVPVHLYGTSPDMHAIRKICDSRNLILVEDCAQAHGATFQNRSAGSWGHLSAWSFYPSKNLGAYGDGGAVATDSEELATKLRMLRNYGQRIRYYHDAEGRNSRLDEIQAAVLRVKLRHLDEWNSRRRAIAAQYDEMIDHAVLEIPAVTEGCEPARHLYPVRVTSGAAARDQLRTLLREEGVDTQIHYPVPIHRQPAYASLFDAERFPEADAACDQVLSLPMFPQLSLDEARFTASELLRSASDLRVST